MINNINIKYYLIPFIILVVIVLITLAIPLIKPNTSPSPTLYISPTPISLPPKAQNIPSPTLIPLQFTGADLSQDIPLPVKTVSEQKTTLRRLTPLTLSFGIIDFDYENDNFVLQLAEPKAESLTQFAAWRAQTYPALTEDMFVIN